MPSAGPIAAATGPTSRRGATAQPQAPPPWPGPLSEWQMANRARRMARTSVALAMARATLDTSWRHPTARHREVSRWRTRNRHPLGSAVGSSLPGHPSKQVLTNPANTWHGESPPAPLVGPVQAKVLRPNAGTRSHTSPPPLQHSDRGVWDQGLRSLASSDQASTRAEHKRAPRTRPSSGRGGCPAWRPRGPTTWGDPRGHDHGEASCHQDVYRSSVNPQPSVRVHACVCPCQQRRL